MRGIASMEVLSYCLHCLRGTHIAQRSLVILFLLTRSYAYGGDSKFPLSNDTLPRIKTQNTNGTWHFAKAGTKLPFIPQGVNWVRLSKDDLEGGENISFSEVFFKKISLKLIQL